MIPQLCRFTKATKEKGQVDASKYVSKLTIFEEDQKCGILNQFHNRVVQDGGSPKLCQVEEGQVDSSNECSKFTKVEEEPLDASNECYKLTKDEKEKVDASNECSKLTKVEYGQVEAPSLPKLKRDR